MKRPKQANPCQENEQGSEDSATQRDQLATSWKRSICRRRVSTAISRFINGISLRSVCLKYHINIYDLFFDKLRQETERKRQRTLERKENVGLGEIDAFATKADEAKLTADELNTLNVVRTGSTWTKNVTFWTGKAEDNMCTLCGQEKETVERLLWECVCLAEKGSSMMQVLRRLTRSCCH